MFARHKFADKQRLTVWRIAFGLSAGAMLALAWHLSTANSIEAQSIGFRYSLSKWLKLQKNVPVNRICIVDLDRSEDLAFFKTKNSKGDPSFFHELLTSVENRHPAVIAVVVQDFNYELKQQLQQVLQGKQAAIIAVNSADLQLHCPASVTAADTFLPSQREIAAYLIPPSPVLPGSKLPSLLQAVSDRTPAMIPPVNGTAVPPAINFFHDFSSPAEPIEGKIVLVGRGNARQRWLAGGMITDLYAQAHVLASMLTGDAYKDNTKGPLPAWFLPLSLLLCACYASLKPLHRFVGWVLACAALQVAVMYYFASLHTIVFFGTVAYLIHCCYVCGTLIYLETETVARKRKMALSLQERSEEERKRIAKDLHDEVLPSLSRIMRQVDKLQERLAGDQTPADIRLQLESVVDETRRVINDLHPVVLENLGLIPAIDHLARRLAAETSMTVELENNSGSDDFALPAFTKLSLYRIVQEALNNVEKHSQATAVHICASCSKRYGYILDCRQRQGHGQAQRSP